MERALLVLLSLAGLTTVVAVATVTGSARATRRVRGAAVRRARASGYASAAVAAAVHGSDVRRSGHHVHSRPRWERSPVQGVVRAAAVLAVVLASGAVVLAGPPAAGGAPTTTSGPMLPGFDANTLAANDDGSTGLVDLPFPIDFFGTTYHGLYVNNNGNVTFAQPLSTYTPSAFTTFGSPIIAPFWADVDTAVQGSSLVTYGTGTVDGHQAFGVNWPGVDCFATPSGGLNYFQMIIIDRSDIAPGDFDIEFNYDSIVWDSGQASGGDASCQGGMSAAVGYTNGTTNSLELAGSFVDGAFLNGGSDALVSGSQNSSTPGRYVFAIRSGGSGGSVSGTVTDDATPPNPVGGAFVSVCGTGPTPATSCYLGTTGTTGAFRVLGVPAGTYTATVSPPSGGVLDETASQSFAVATGGDTTQDVTLHGPTPPPNGTVVAGVGTTTIGNAEVPIVYWQQPSPVTTHACAGGTVSATVTAVNSINGATGTTPPVPFTEVAAQPGTFAGTLPALYPLHGAATVIFTISGCLDATGDGAVSFTIYIDPSGTVVDGNAGDAPVAGATVTLLSSDSATGTFTPVPDGSPVMSPGNRSNPSTTDTEGRFGWDTVPGYYEVEATKLGCGTAASPVLTVPPPAVGLRLVLHCAEAPAGPAITTSSLPYGNVGSAYLAGLTGSGGGTPYTWSVPAGSLPAGLVLDPTTGVISGTPTADGIFAVPVTVTGAAGGSTTHTFPLGIADGPPSVAVLLPAGGATVSSGVWLDAGASSPIGVTSVRFEVSGGSIVDQTVGMGAPTIDGWIGGMDSTLVPNGTYVLQAVATDAAGTQAVSAGVLITVDNHPLASQVLLPTGGSVLHGSVVLAASSTGMHDDVGSVFVLESASGGPTLIADGVLTPYGWLARWDSTSIPNGTYQLFSVAIDVTGAGAVSAPVSVTVANTTP